MGNIRRSEITHCDITSTEKKHLLAPFSLSKCSVSLTKLQLKWQPRGSSAGVSGNQLQLFIVSKTGIRLLSLNFIKLFFILSISWLYHNLIKL